MNTYRVEIRTADKKYKWIIIEAENLYAGINQAEKLRLGNVTGIIRIHD